MPQLLSQDLVARWPGKGGESTVLEHPAVLHMLDVAAVAECLAPPLPEPLRQACLLLAALHDLGKIGVPYRAMLRQGQTQSAGRHWEVTEMLLRHHDARLEPMLGGTWRQRFEIYAAVAGHHGRPPAKDPANDGPQFRAMRAAAGPEALADSGLVIDAFLALWPGASLAALPDLAAAKALSWRLNGLITAADWIGSNPLWFPPQPPTGDLPAYLARARTQARRAVAEAGLAHPLAATTRLFDFPPRPMQAACATVPLREGPMLAVIEDETGSGKTEAALLLAQRMLLAGKGRGLYFALPTMATADAMFARLAPLAEKLFSGSPSLILSHGHAGLSAALQDLATLRARDPEEPGPTPWLLDSRRRALLATMGAGTIDQALLAVLRARFSTLRQFGLASKILIVDEAHEMGDPYMGELLQALLRMQAAQGGSAILMSATLEDGLRGRLIAAFEDGAGRPSAAPSAPAYPALTVPGAETPPVAATPSPRGPLRVQRLPELSQALDLLAEAAGQGAACVLIRNAVDEALAACAALRARGVPTDLLHARFAFCDRRRLEDTALATFGKARAARPGRVLVATQVVESSLDLDFDVMVSDLAPMPALIQRAGRLWRHMALRPAAGRPVPGPCLHVLSPDPGQVSGPDWVGPVLGKGAGIYEAPTLWRTARALFAAGEIRAPEGLPALIAAAFDEAAPLPGPLQGGVVRAAGKAGAARTVAGHNRIALQDGYRSGASGAPDEVYPTRLGLPQRVLVLMRAGQPWAGGDWSVAACQRSEVSASKARLDRLPLPESIAPPGLPDWLTNSRHFLNVGLDGSLCAGLRYDAALGLIFD